MAGAMTSQPAQFERQIGVVRRVCNLLDAEVHNKVYTQAIDFKIPNRTKKHYYFIW